MDTSEIQAWHILAIMAGWFGTFIGLFAMIWRTWIAPYRREQTLLNEWRWGVNARLDSGDSRMARMEDDHRGVNHSLDEVKKEVTLMAQCLVRIETTLKEWKPS